LTYKYFSGYREDQFLFLIVSLDPWGVLRGFTLPDDVTIETNMSGYKKKQGDIEVLLIGDRYSGLVEIEDFKYSVLPSSLKHFKISNASFQPFGYILIEIEEESTAIIETDPLGIHPAYYGFLGNDVIFSVRRKWLESITNNIFDIPNHSIVELSYRSAKIKNKDIIREENSSAVENIIEFMKNLSSDKEKEIIYLYRGLGLDEKFLEILEFVKLQRKAKIIPVNSHSKSNLTKYLKENNIEPEYYNILWDKTPSNCINEESCIKQILAILKRESLVRNTYFRTIILSHFLKRENTIKFFESDKCIIEFVKERNLFEWFRELFNIAWPVAIIDPFFSSKNLLIRGKEFIKKLSD